MPWGTVELEPEDRAWLHELPTARFATAAFSIDLLAETGPLLGEPYTRQLDGKLRELRFHLDRQALRITYWIATGRRIILLTVFVKSRCVRHASRNARSVRWRAVWPKSTRSRRNHDRANELERAQGSSLG
jgi:hypothetical protein